MQYFLFILKSALEDFKRNKIRTFLTSLGILIGVSSVILLLALGLGLKKYIQDQFESLGTNLIYVLPGNMVSGGSFQRSGPPSAKFDERDVLSLKKIKNTTAVIPFLVKMVKVQAEGNSEMVEIAASSAELFSVLNVEIDKGVAFEKRDVEKRSKKVVLGSKIAEKLFKSADNALDKIVKIDDQGYKVVGVAKAKGGGGLGAPSMDDHVYIPYKTAYNFFSDKKFFTIYLKSDASDSLLQVKEEAKKILLKRYKEDDFSVVEQTEFLQAINSIFNIINTVLVAIAAISLLVGGIGIMNIMYVSVVERIREIGIRRAVGATRIDILFQFLAESVLLSLSGGVIGLSISFMVVSLIQSLFPAYIDLSSIIIALGVSSTIGIVFGVLPAKRAADLTPVEAVRYE